MLTTMAEAYTPWLSLKIMRWPEKDIEGYAFSHEERSDGIIISILPFRRTTTGKEYLLRNEITPPWHPTLPKLSSITGGFERKHGIEGTALLELKEEAGYEVKEPELISLGTCHGTKSSDTVYHLFSVNLTGKKPGKITGDGSVLEKKATNEWKTDILNAVDPLVFISYVRLLSKGV